jgi:DNA-binding CsgD family transcriptional regulator
MEQTELLHKQEKEFHLNKEHSLELELDYKNRQLTSYALHLARNSEFVQRTTDDLQHILLGTNPRDKERSERIKEMISDLHQYSSGHDWQEFRLYFEEVHQSFEKNLSTAFPDLSPNDKKICALLKLGLSTKEIASITFRELRSVESARNRLRKKLGLAADVNIHSFLSHF